MKYLKQLSVYLLTTFFAIIVWLSVLIFSAWVRGGSNSPQIFRNINIVFLIFYGLIIMRINIYYHNKSKDGIEKLIRAIYQDKKRYLECYKLIFHALYNKENYGEMKYRDIKSSYTADVGGLGVLAAIVTVWIAISNNVDRIYNALYRFAYQISVGHEFEIENQNTDLLYILILVIIIWGIIKIISHAEQMRYILSVYADVENDILKRNFAFALSLYEDDDEMKKKLDAEVV